MQSYVDPERLLRPPLARDVDAGYPGLPATSAIYRLLCDWYQTRLQYISDRSFVDAMIKARYFESFDQVIVCVARSMIHTILCCVEYPQIRRRNKLTEHLAEHARRRQLRLSAMMLEERSAAALDAVYVIMLHLIEQGDAYAWMTKLRQRFVAAYLSACERDAGQQTFRGSYVLQAAAPEPSILRPEYKTPRFPGVTCSTYSR